jgi:hypothetical protein
MPGLLVVVSSGTPFTAGTMLRKAFIVMGIILMEIGNG